MADLRVEVAGLKTQLEESEKARSRSTTAVNAQSSAAATREAELSEALRQARQAAARAAYSGEDDVIAIEKTMRAKHEREVAELQARASELEERVRVKSWGGGRVGVGACTQFLCMAVVVLTIDPRIPTLPGRSMSGFHRAGRHCLHQARSAVWCSASGMKGELHLSKNGL